MKNIVYLTVMLLTVLMIGCKEDAVSPVVPEPPQTLPINEQLDNRSRELFNQGTDVVIASNILTGEFELSDSTILKSLSDAGYNSSDIVKAVHLVFNYKARPAENLLLYVLDDEIKVQIAELILLEYPAELKINRDDLKYFISLIPDIVKQISILKDTYGESAEEAALILKELGVELIVIIQNIQKAYSLTEAEVLILLINLNLSADEMTELLQQVLNYTYEAVFEYLNNNSYILIDICTALKEHYNLNIRQFYDLLHKYNHDVTEIIFIFTKLKFELREIITELKNHYDYAEIFDPLRENDYQLEDILKNLKEVYNLTIMQIRELLERIYNNDVQNIIQLLHQIGYNYNEIGVLLEQEYNYNKEMISQFLKDIGASAKEICDFLISRYNSEVEEIAPILKNIGYDLIDNVLAVWDHIKWQIQRILDIFTLLGYEACDILEILGIKC